MDFQIGAAARHFSIHDSRNSMHKHEGHLLDWSYQMGMHSESIWSHLREPDIDSDKVSHASLGQVGRVVTVARYKQAMPSAGGRKSATSRFPSHESQDHNRQRCPGRGEAKCKFSCVRIYRAGLG